MSKHCHLLENGSLKVAHLATLADFLLDLTDFQLADFLFT